MPISLVQPLHIWRVKDLYTGETGHEAGELPLSGGWAEGGSSHGA